MRRFVCATAVSLTAISLSACSSSEPASMPEIVGVRLDVALSDIERAGFDDEVEVLGGGTFGVLDESNWTVCNQEPGSGEEITSAPRITVDRSCKSNDQTDAEAAESDADADDQAVAAERKKEKKRKRRAVAAVSDTFVMPALVGMNLQEAQNRLQARGSFLLTQTDGTGQERFQMLDYNWKVCAQRPAAGTVTDVATLVELVAVKLSESC